MVMDWTNKFKVVSLYTALEIQQRCQMNRVDYLCESTTRYYHHLSFPKTPKLTSVHSAMVATCLDLIFALAGRT